MAQQESEDRVVPQGRRKPSPIHGVESRGGGKAVPVEKAVQQQLLLFATADNPRVERGAARHEIGDRSPTTSRATPKATSKQRRAGSATMEEVIECLDAERDLRWADAHIRRRLRALVLKHWRTRSTIARRLIRLGVRPKTAWRRVQEGRKSLWALSHDPAVDRALRNAYFARRGLVSLVERFRRAWAANVAPRQHLLAWDTPRP